MVSDELLDVLHRLNRADKMRVVQVLVNELAEAESAESSESNIEAALDAMAADPHIQREIALINAEFSETDFDGLGNKT